MNIFELIIFVLLNLRNLIHLTLFISDEGCPSIGQPRKHVVCYYDGKRPVSSLNICLCTHLIYTSIGINDYGELHLSESKFL